MNSTIASLVSERVLTTVLITLDIVLILIGESLAYFWKFKTFDGVPPTIYRPGAGLLLCLHCQRCTCIRV